MSEKIIIDIETPDGQKKKMEAHPKVFKTGSTGYHTNGRIFIDGHDYLYNFLFTKVGSKRKTNQTQQENNESNAVGEL